MILHYAKENRLVRLGSFIFRAFLNADAFGCVLLFSNGNGRDVRAFMDLNLRCVNVLLFIYFLICNL